MKSILTVLRNMRKLFMRMIEALRLNPDHLID